MTNREHLIRLIEDACRGCARYRAEDIADNLISEGVEVRARAEWENECGNTLCSICHAPAPIHTVKVGIGDRQMRLARTNFCPHCGARMMGG